MNLNELEAIDWSVPATLEHADARQYNILRKRFQPSRGLVQKAFCDEKVPEALRESFLERLRSAFNDQEPWKRDKDREQVKCAMEEMTVRSWKGKGGRMERWSCPEPEECAFVVFGVGELGLVIGQYYSHPFIICNTFCYNNSDGSYFAQMPLSGSAEDMFSWVLKIFNEFCDNRYH